MNVYTFTNNDKLQLIFIKEVYAQHIGPTDGVNFETKSISRGLFRSDSTTSNKTITKSSVTNVDFWLQKTGHGVCREHVETMLREILEYQSKRLEENTFFERDLGDPTDMLLNEFKGWLLELSKDGLDQTTSEAHLANVRKRIKFLQALDDRKMFPPGLGTTHFSRLELFESLKLTLEKKVVPLLKAVPGLLSAREEFKALHERSKALLKTGIQIAFLIFKNTHPQKTPRIISVYDAFLVLENGSAGPWFEKGLLKTTADHLIEKLSLRCGKLLENGVPIGEIQENFFNVPNGFEKNDYFFNQLTSQDSGIDRYFLDRHKESQTSGKNSPLLLLLKFEQCLYEFAKVTALIGKGYEMAGMGNNLLLYGLLQDKVLLLVDLYRAVLFSGLEETLREIENSVAPRKRNKDKRLGFTLFSHWGSHYEVVKKEIPRFFEDVEHLKKSVEIIRTNVQSLDLGALLNKAQRKMDQFSRDLDVVHGHLLRNYPSFTTLPQKQDRSNLEEKPGPATQPVLLSDEKPYDPDPPKQNSTVTAKKRAGFLSPANSNFPPKQSAVEEKDTKTETSEGKVQESKTTPSVTLYNNLKAKNQERKRKDPPTSTYHANAKSPRFSGSQKQV